jgi:hypothetical protein
MCAQKILSFDTDRFPLRSLVQQAVGIEALETLHEHEPETLLPTGVFKGAPHTRSALRRTELQQHTLQELWKMSSQRKDFLQLLPVIIADVIAPTLPEETFFYFQKAPLLRFHVAWPETEGEDSFAASEGKDQPKKRGKPPGTLTTMHTDGEVGMQHTSTTHTPF